MYAFFGQITTSDTIKVCYDAWIYEANSMEVCTSCDSLVFDQNTYSWVLFSLGNPVGIAEVVIDRLNSNRIYDILGRELTEIPLGKLYIRNNKKYITNE